MEKKDLIPGGDAVHYLKIAALYPQRRSEMIAHALQNLLVSLPAVGTALIWPRQDRNVPWKVYYTGPRQESIRPWLAARLDGSFDAMLGVLQQDLCSLADMPFPHLICLQPAPMFPAGLWIVWTIHTPLPQEAINYQEEVRLTLEALIEVQSSEERYFSSTSPLSDQALIEGLGQGDSQALSAYLGMTRLVGHAEMTAWGRVYQDVIETKDHIGAKDSGFGFVIPNGSGMGGRIIKSGIPIVLAEDYLNSPYRHPSVADIVDSERLRSVIALPVHARQGQERSKHVAGVFYAARRSVKPFSLAEQLLMQRVTHRLEPMPPPPRPTTFLSPGLPTIPNMQAEWYKLVLQANHIESLEAWVGQYIHGTIIVTDSEARPYVSARAEQLENLRASFDRAMDGVQVLSLEAPGVSLPGQVYLRSAVALPPANWPDFFPDLVMACNLIIGRMEQARNHLAHQREQWLRAALQGKSHPQIRHDGHQLGLPVEEGQLWVIAWPMQGQRQGSPKGDEPYPVITPTGMGGEESHTGGLTTRMRMLAENVVLELLEIPLFFLGDDIGVILFDSHAQPEPSRLREALLKLFAPHAFWIVYGAHYHSIHELKKVLTHSISLGQKARREVYREYLLDVQTPGLESLLVKPRLSEDLRHFATKQLAPLLEYDKSKGTDLTTIFVLVHTLGSVQAVSDELDIHVNTLRYRLRKAEEILGIEEASANGRISWGFVAFIWKSFHPIGQTPTT